MRRFGNPFALLGALCVLALGATALGCGDPQPPVNRVGVNVVEKSAFTGSWYMHQTIIDLDYEGAPTGFVGANAGDATGGFLGFSIPRIRWVIDEDFLYAYRDYELVGDPEDPFEVRGDEDEDYLGQPVAAFRIDSHFDIRREYNSVTGEERNIVVENTTDHHWYERQFMRVDWSQNLVSPAFTSGGQFVQSESAQLFVQDESEFPAEWRPQFHFMSCNGMDDAECDADDRDWAMDYSQGDMYSMSFVSQAFLAPAPIPMFGILCRFSDEVEQFFPSAPECATTQITFRTSFLRVSETREYEPVGWTHDRFNRAGYFALDRTTYDRSNRAGDPSYGVTDFTNQSTNRHNIWLQWFQRDANGEIMRDENGRPLPMPYAERDVRQILWYTSREVPAHLMKPSWEVISQWNEVMMSTVRELRGQDVPQYSAVDCQTSDPGAYCFCQNDPDSGVVLNPTCPGRYDPYTPPSEARVDSGEPFDCYVAQVDENGEPVGDALALEPDWNDPSLSDSDFSPWFETAMVGSECVNVLRVNTCHQGNVDEWDNLDCQQRGDIRYKLLSLVDQPGTPFLGVAQLRGDPLTGEVLTGDANIGGPAMDSQRTFALETYDLINGNITDEQFYSGEDVRQYLNALAHVELPAPPRIDFSVGLRQGVDVDPTVRAGISGVMERAMQRAELLRGAEGRAAVFTDRIHELAGTDIEARLASSPEMLAIAGFDQMPEGASAESIPEHVLDAISPFRNDPLERFHEIRDNELRMGLQNIMMPNEYTDNSVLAYVNEHRDWTRVRVEFDLNRRLYRDTQVHEMGHCLGLRHHFGGTADPNNYFDGYYTIDQQYPLPNPNDFNTDGTAGLSPAEQIAFEDAYEAADRRRELAGIDQWMNSSVMDYTPNWYQRINGAGYHDRMAISFGYGDLVDIYDNTTAADGSARPPLTMGEINPINTRRVAIKYYHGGEVCNEAADCPFSAEGSRSGELLPANTASGLTQRCVPSGRTDELNVCSNFDEDAREATAAAGPRPDWVPVDYFYCEDIRSSTRSLPGCAIFDEGDSFRDIVKNQVTAYERSYLFNNFRRYRRSFSTYGYGGRIIRYLDPLLGIYTNLIHRYATDPSFREQTGPFGFEDEFLATADTMNFFARMMSQPSIGSYEYQSGWDRYELTSIDIRPDAQVVVPFGQGRYLNSIYQTGLTGINRVERIGSFYDSIYAMLFMTARGISPFYGTDVVFQTNFYDIFPNEMQQIFTGMIAGRPEEYMPRLECTSGTFPTCDESRLVYMDFYRGDCSVDPATGEPRVDTCRPNPTTTYQDLEVINGGTRIALQSYAAIFSLQSFPIYYDTAFQNQMFVCVEGQGDCYLPDDVSTEGVDYVRYTSRRFGKSFLAWQVEASEGVASQTSIAFSMVKEARDTEFIIRMLRTYRGDFVGGDPAPSIDHLTPEQQAEIAAIGYEFPTSEDQISFEIERLDSRLISLEGFFFYLVQLEREFGIEFPIPYVRPEI